MHPETRKHITKVITMTQLFEYYRQEEVEGYCKTCPNYDKIWSCPPYDLDVIEPLKSYDRVLLLGIETTDFSMTKKTIANAMNEIASEMPPWAFG